MEFAPLRGWLKNGQQAKQSFKGWDVLAQQPKVPATPVVVLTAEDYAAVLAVAGREPTYARETDGDKACCYCHADFFGDGLHEATCPWWLLRQSVLHK